MEFLGSLPQLGAIPNLPTTTWLMIEEEEKRDAREEQERNGSGTQAHTPSDLTWVGWMSAPPRSPASPLALARAGATPRSGLPDDLLPLAACVPAHSIAGVHASGYVRSEDSGSCVGSVVPTGADADGIVTCRLAIIMRVTPVASLRLFLNALL